MKSYALLVSLLALFCSSSLFAQETPPGNPPQVMVAESIDQEGNLRLVYYRTIYIGFEGDSYNNRHVREFSLDDVVIRTVGGEKVSLEAARKRLEGKESPVLISGYREEIADFYRGLFNDDALCFVFPRKSPVWEPIQDPTRSIR